MNIQTTDWNKFRTFYHVAKAGSFTRAAENLHICQPSLSRSIMSLEASLKMRLLKRSSKGVIPTEEGKVLLETVDAMLNAFLRYGEKLNNKNEEPQGLLKVAMLKTLPSLHLSWLIPKFLKAYPLGLYASAEYLQLNGTPQKAEDLEEHRLIALGNPENLSSCAVNGALEVGMTQGKQRMPSLCLNSISEMKQAVKAGLGIAALPEEYIAEDLSFIRVLPEIPTRSIDLYYVYPTYHKETKRVTAYGEFLADQLKTFNPAKIEIKREETRFFGLKSGFHTSYAQQEA